MIDKSEAAFPISRETEGWHNPGMSLRDWFAGQFLASGITTDAERCYAMADAMLKARENKDV